MRPYLSLALMCAMLTASPVSAQPRAQAQPPADVVFERDITYGKAGEVELKLNMARPAGHDDKAKPLPVIVVIHGGGWAAGVMVTTMGLCQPGVWRSLSMNKARLSVEQPGLAHTV